MTIQIIRDDYFTGPGRRRRDLEYTRDWTPAIETNAAKLVPIVNKLLLRMSAFGVSFETDPQTGSLVHSGWRPPEINAATPGAAVHSNHMLGLAVDLYDPHGLIDDWCLTHQDALAEIGIYLEHPASTKGWSHWQCVAPRSGNRVFYP